MTKEELAAKLNGREYRSEMTRSEVLEANAAGLVVVYGASDDLMEFSGAFSDEVGCYNGGTAYLNAGGLLENGCNEDDDCPHFAKIKAKAATIEALWCKEPGPSWTYKTDIPHATFEVVDDDEPYCRGIVFALADVESRKSAADALLDALEGMLESCPVTNALTNAQLAEIIADENASKTIRVQAGALNASRKAIANYRAARSLGKA